MRFVYIVLLVVFIAVVLIFSFQNTRPVTVSFLRWSATLPLFVVVIGAYLLGMASGGSVAGFVRHSVEGARRRPKSAEGGTRK
ncbi:MAG: LapA family protein [Chloroflexota bacterium]